MKKIATLLLAAGLMLGGTTAAQAIDIKPSGGFEFVANWGSIGGDKALPGNGAGGSSKNHTFAQRFRLFFDITASESVRGMIGLEGNTVWGRNNTNAGSGTGGAIGTRGVNIELLDAYVDWIPPHTDLRVRMGLQLVANPSFVQDSFQVFGGDRMAGITTSYQFTPNVGAVAWWVRPYAENGVAYGSTAGGVIKDRRFNDIDAFGLAVPLSFDGVKVTPWGMYASIGRDALFNQGATQDAIVTGRSTGHAVYTLPIWNASFAGMTGSSKGEGNGWWLGLTGELTLWNPFRLAWDFNYGSVNMGRTDRPADAAYAAAYPNDAEWKNKRQGWIVTTLAEYKLDFMTPGLAFWYASGDGSNWKKGSGMMPSIRPHSKLTSFGQDTYSWVFPANGIGNGVHGTWGIMAQLKDLTFLEDLKHNVRIAYYRGTNSNKGVQKINNPDTAPNGQAIFAFRPNGNSSYLTTKDSAWEFNLDSYYNIYKNLQLCVELGYIKPSMNRNTWGKALKDRSEDMYKVTIGMRYMF